MNLGQYIERIDRYLIRDEHLPLIVDVQNEEDWSALITHYKVGANQIVPSFQYCNKDELPRMADVFEMAATATGTVFITGVTSFLKLQGELVLRRVLRQMLSMTVNGHVVFVSYQCKPYLFVNDPRLLRRVLIIDGDEQRVPEIVMTAPDLPIPRNVTTITGIENIASTVENTSADKLYLITSKNKNMYPHSLFPLRDLQSAYEAILQKDISTNVLGESCGTDEQWSYALSLFEKSDSWIDVIDNAFGGHQSLEHIFPNFKNFNGNEKWLYFVALKLYGAKTNWCLRVSAEKADGLQNFIHQLFMCLLDKNATDKDFWAYYDARKNIVAQLTDAGAELNLYCSLVFAKGVDALCYLTDNTQKEKEAVFKYLDQYGLDVERQKLTQILRKVYPDLYNYLQPYRFKNDLLDRYFQDYKYQKVINKILPGFENVVKEQAEKRDYNLILEPRTSVVETLNRSRAQLYFMDAMGVEYLSYILAECRKLGLNAHITVCRSELPSITSCNKEFLELFSDGELPIVSIKDIDDIKHHGKDDYDFYKNSKLPIYLIKELEIIRKTLVRIKEKLSVGYMDRAFMIADHGASRLAVLHDTENIWEMTEKGEHSGRCCPKSDVDQKPAFATDAGDFWALANYDRFKGGRKANVEVHGGATLEEICVPVIELTVLDNTLRVYLLSVDSDKVDFDKIVEIEVSFRKKAALKIFSTASLKDVNVVVNGTYYEAVPLGGNFFRVDMPEIKKPDTYYAEIRSGDTTIAEKLPFVIKREGQRVKDIL